MKCDYDFIVVGLGFYGLRTVKALLKMGFSVLGIEQEAEEMQRASLINQARVHNGYHYPRSLATAMASHINYYKFYEEYEACIHKTNKHNFYAISKKSSNISAYQFKSFCNRIGLPLSSANPEWKLLFNKEEIEDIFAVEEATFDAVKLLAEEKKQLSAFSVNQFKTIYQQGCKRVEIGQNFIACELFSNEIIYSKGIFLTCYSGINPLLMRSQLKPLALKGELTEICLVQLPEELKSIGVTVMDGPFFSCLPYPSRQCHSLTHVRYTPRYFWDASEVSFQLTNLKLENRFNFMRNATKKYIPLFEKIQYIQSMFEIKVVPLKNEVDDGRPILVKLYSKQPLLCCVLGSKIDNVYEWENYLINFLKENKISATTYSF